MGEMLHSGKRPKTFQGASSNIPRNVTKHSWKCRQTLWGISSKTPGNITKRSGECCQTFQGILPNIPRNILKNSGEVCVTQGNQDTESVQDSILLILWLFLIKRIRRQGEPKIPLCNLIGGKLLLGPFLSQNKLLLRVAFRTLVKTHDGALLQKYPTTLTR